MAHVAAIKRLRVLHIYYAPPESTMAIDSLKTVLLHHDKAYATVSGTKCLVAARVLRLIVTGSMCYVGRTA